MLQPISHPKVEQAVRAGRISVDRFNRDYGRRTGAKRATTLERPTSKDVRMAWARRLKRVFGIEIEQCVRCGGRLKVIASIEGPELIERILAHRREQGEEEAPRASLGARAPPQTSLF